MLTLKRGNDHLITLPGLRDATGDYLNAATVTATLVDKHGVSVPQFNEMLMSYVDASDGDYTCEVEGQSLMILKSSLYTLVVVATQSEVNFRDVVPITVTD